MAADGTRWGRALRMIASRLVIGALALAATLLALEVFVRVAGEVNADGQFIFAGRELQPYALPLQRLDEQVREYTDNQDTVKLIHDERLGWKFRPNSTRQDGEFTINGRGLRGQRDYALEPSADTLRIALFGDSFTAGDDASDATVWSHLLEANLNSAGLRAEVLNFGVSAYGMDQAYLRWLHDGVERSPDIVIFGLQAENLDRNVNVFRQLIHPDGPAFSKPRFVLAGDELELVNSPAIPPQRLMEVFESFDSHPAAVHEAYYRSRDYVRQWWAGSKLASFVYSVVSERGEEAQIGYDLDSERGDLGKAIVDAFAEDVGRRGKSFVVVFLPHKWHFIRWYWSGQTHAYQPLLESFSDSHHYVSFADHLTPDYMSDDYWGPTLHYGTELNRKLAELVAAETLDCVQSGACPLPRFDDVSVIYKPGAR